MMLAGGNMDEIQKNIQRDTTRIKWLAAIIAAVLMMYAFKVAQVFFAPVLFTAIIAMLVAPVQQRLDFLLKGKYAALNLVLTLLVIIVVVGIFIEGIWFSGTIIAHRAPAYSGKFTQLWLQFSAWAGRHHIPVQLSGAQASSIAQKALGSLAVLLSSLSSLISMLGLILILLLLTLMELRQWREKLRGSPDGGTGRQALETMDTIALKVRQYLFILTVLNVLTGVAVGAWLLVLGIDFAPVLGVLAFLFNYIPYIGSFIVAFLAALVALLQYGPGHAVAVLAGLIVINQVNGTFLQPRLTGKSVTVSPAFLFLSIVFWSWMWGIEGTLLAVPIAIAIVVAADTIPAFRPFIALLKMK
jgi:AI-2 transport protein TqsA